ncbi:MAG: hypothetical protein ABI538_12925 [Pseudoxanthomonas sp.]
MTSFLRPVALTAARKAGSSQALSVLRSIGSISGRAVAADAGVEGGAVAGDLLDPEAGGIRRNLRGKGGRDQQQAQAAQQQAGHGASPL